jgi:DNA-binding CsgD family transcriptional regulator
MPLSPRDLSFAEATAQQEAEERGEPYLLFRDGSSSLRIFALAARREVAVGRLGGSEIAIEWDDEVSRAHAVLERVGDEWTVVDDGLSRNGTYLNGMRVLARTRLRDRDLLRFGRTEMLFCDPLDREVETAPPAVAAQVARLSAAQHRVLVELCRPAAAAPLAAPASNREIAATLHLSVEAVRTHLKALFQRFDVPELPQNRKRAELARRALEAGAVGPRDLKTSR